MARERGLATVLFTDIVGSTEKAAELGDKGWRALLRKHHELVRRELRRFEGREVSTAGDGFLMTFDRPADAILCACAIRDAVRGLGLEIRSGMHMGAVEWEEENIGGIAVHIGARVAAHAAPGEVLFRARCATSRRARASASRSEEVVRSEASPASGDSSRSRAARRHSRERSGGEVSHG